MRALFVLMLCGLIYSQGKSQFYYEYDNAPLRHRQANVIKPNVTSCEPVKQPVILGSTDTCHLVKYEQPIILAHRCTGSCNKGYSCQRERSRVINGKALVQRYDTLTGAWRRPILENVAVEDHTSCKWVQEPAN